MEKKIQFYNLFHIKQIVIKGTMIKFEEKKLKGCFKILKRHVCKSMREKEKKKNKHNIKSEIRWPHASS